MYHGDKYTCLLRSDRQQVFRAFRVAILGRKHEGSPALKIVPQDLRSAAMLATSSDVAATRGCSHPHSDGPRTGFAHAAICIELAPIHGRKSAT